MAEHRVPSAIPDVYNPVAPRQSFREDRTVQVVTGMQDRYLVAAPKPKPHNVAQRVARPAKPKRPRNASGRGGHR